MNKVIRILIATGVAVVVLFGSVALILLIFDVQSPKIAAILSFTSWIITYKLIKPSKEEIRKKETKHVENYDPNGVLREKGEMVFGKKEGEWDIFNEDGMHIKTIVYLGGEEKYSKNADPL